MAAIYVSQVLLFGVHFATKGILGPVELGIWSLLLAVLSFLSLLELGVVQAANKEISYSLSRGEEEIAERLKGVQYSFVVLTSVLGSLGVLLYALVMSGQNGKTLTLGLLSIALILPISQIHMGQVSVYWANWKFSATGGLVIFDAVLAGTVGLWLVWGFGVVGQIAVFMLILLVKVGVLSRQAGRDSRLKVNFSWDAKALRHLLKIGIPLQVINLANIFKISGTVFLISYFFDTRAVGFYALALSVQNFIYWTPNAFSVVMFPRFQSRYASTNDEVAALHSYLVKPLYGLGFFLLPVLLSAAYFMVPPLIEHALPAYGPTIPLLAAILPGTFFMSMEHMPGQLLTTANRLWERVLIAVLGIALIVVCISAAAVLDSSLFGFVLSLSVSSILAFLILFSYANHLAKGSESTRFLGSKLVGAFLYLVAVVLAIDRVLPVSHGSWQGDLLAALGKWAMSLVLLTPLFLVAERNLGLVAAIRHLLGDLLRRAR